MVSKRYKYLPKETKKLKSETIENLLSNVIGLPVFSELTPEQRPPIADLIQTIFEDENILWWTMYESNRPQDIGEQFQPLEYDINLNSLSNGQYYLKIYFHKCGGGSHLYINDLTIENAYNLGITPPIGLSATSGREQITLSWNANNEAGLSHYNIYSGLSSNPTTLIATVSANEETFIHTELTTDETYYYRITAENIGGYESDYSNEVYATPISYYIVWTEGGSGNTKIYHFSTDTWETISSPGGANGGYIDMTYDIESDRVIWVKGDNGQSKAYDFNTNT